MAEAVFFRAGERAIFDAWVEAVEIGEFLFASDLPQSVDRRHVVMSPRVECEPVLGGYRLRRVS